jgi:hypothetical protein
LAGWRWCSGTDAEGCCLSPVAVDQGTGPHGLCWVQILQDAGQQVDVVLWKRGVNNSSRRGEAVVSEQPSIPQPVWDGSGSWNTPLKTSWSTGGWLSAGMLEELFRGLGVVVMRGLAKEPRVRGGQVEEQRGQRRG